MSHFNSDTGTYDAFFSYIFFLVHKRSYAFNLTFVKRSRIKSLVDKGNLQKGISA